MSTFIGILELIAWAAAVIGLACGVTYGVVKLLPGKDLPKPGPAADDT